MAETTVMMLSMAAGLSVLLQRTCLTRFLVMLRSCPHILRASHHLR